MTEGPCVALGGRLHVHLERPAAADRDPSRGDVDVAQNDRDVLALTGGRLIAGEILRADREDVPARGKLAIPEPAVPLDLGVESGQAAEGDLPVAEVDERMRLLAERVPDRDRAAGPGQEEGLETVRGTHLRRLRVNRDLVRELERVAPIREGDPRVVDAVRHQGAGVGAAVPDEVLLSMGAQEAVAAPRRDRAA